MAVKEEPLIGELGLPCRLSGLVGTVAMRPKVKLGPWIHKGYHQVASFLQVRQSGRLGSVHQITDYQSTLLDAVGEELVVSPVNLSREDAKEGRQETCLNFLLQGRKECGCVSNYTLNVLPFILKAKHKPGVGSLGIALAIVGIVQRKHGRGGVYGGVLSLCSCCQTEQQKEEEKRGSGNA
jgi:hypothetical protein